MPDEILESCTVCHVAVEFIVQKVHAECQPLYSLTSAPSGIWFVCTVFVHILLSKNLGFSKLQYFLLCICILN